MMRNVISMMAMVSLAMMLSMDAAAQGGGAGGRGGSAGAGGGAGAGAPGAQGEPGAPSRRAAPPARGGFGGAGGVGGSASGGAGGMGGMALPPVQIGIAMDRVGDALAAQLGLEAGQGILVVNVVDDGPAAEAGLKRFDIITQVDGQSPVTPDSIREVLQDREPGDELTLRVLRGGKSQELTITLGEPQVRFRGGAIGRVELTPETLEEMGVSPEQVREFRLQRRLRDPELNERVYRLREESAAMREEAARLAESLREQWRQHLGEFELDEATRSRLSEWFERAAAETAAAMKRAAEAVRDVEIDVDLRAPRVEILRERGGGRGMIVHPDGERREIEIRQRANAMQREIERERDDVRRPGPEMDRRLGALEERLERMERMMQRLLEREESQ